MTTTSRYIEDLSAATAKDAAPGQIIDLTIGREVRVAIVGPKGQFNVVGISASKKGSTACTVFWSEEQGAPVIPARHSAIQDDGLPAFVFYRQGCQQKGTMDNYTRWKAIDDEQQRCRSLGLPLPKFLDLPQDFYADWVMARRALWQSGRREIDATAFLNKVVGVKKQDGQVHVEIEQVPREVPQPPPLPPRPPIMTHVGPRPRPGDDDERPE